MEHLRSGTKILVQRGTMGGRTVYTALLTLREQNSLVPPRPESGALEDREQRLTDPGHAAEIAQYVADVEDYFLPGLMAFLHEDADFEPLRDESGVVLTDRIGFLWIDGNIGRSLGDGMHRGMGIEAALNGGEDSLANDTIVVSFVVEKDRDRRRQLFNDINRTQKRVAKSLGVSYDSRHPISVAVNRMVESHPLGILVEREKATAGRESGLLTTSGTLFDAVSILLYGWSGRPGRRSARIGIEEAQDATTLLMDALMALQDIEDVLDSSDPGEAMNQLRARSILGSGTTVKALAGAVFVARGRLRNDDELRRAFVALNEIAWDPAAWVEVGFVPAGGRTPHARAQEVRKAGLTIASHLAPVEPN